jgi:hypothetical protein
MWYGKAATGLPRSTIVLALVAGTFLSGCGLLTPRERIVYRDRPVEVQVPIPVFRTPPAALVAPLPRPVLHWQPPSDEAQICLINEDARALRHMTWAWSQRDKAWRVWASNNRSEP